MSTTTATMRASACNLSPSSNLRHAAFAREAALDAFGRQGRWALDEPDFLDHASGRGLRQIGEVPAKVVDDDDGRAPAFEVAAGIARVMSLAQVDLTGRKVA